MGKTKVRILIFWGGCGCLKSQQVSGQSASAAKEHRYMKYLLGMARVLNCIELLDKH